jgi:DNA-binding NarL/FixJ family response regulator
MTLFIVEDSPLITDRLVVMLDELDSGVQIIGQADTAAGAIASIESLRPDAVILDLRLRTGNGLEVIERVKRDPRSPLVMVLTNSPQDHYRRRCLAAGAEYFFDKSTEFERVRGVVQQLVDGTRTT